MASDYFDSLHRVARLVPRISRKAVVYGGATSQTRGGCEVVPLAGLPGLLEGMDAR